MFEYERMVLGGACLCQKEWCLVEYASVRKSGVRWHMLK